MQKKKIKELKTDCNHLKSDLIKAISTALNCGEDDITIISVLNGGMTNRSVLFSAKGFKYIMRIPGGGTEQLINRNHEAEVFRTISGHGLCDDPVYINPDNGYKITSFLEGVRTCDSENEEDVKRCMDKLRELHQKRLKVDHIFDIFGQIDYYESLLEGDPSMYHDYQMTKNNVFGLKPFIDSIQKAWCLAHIDAISDNFLFYTTPEGEEGLQLIDWEYSGMQDPHVDIAMFCVYSQYSREQCDRLIDIYFDGSCDQTTRAKIYIYIAACGLLWSNWCEYKRKFGEEFGEYSYRQYCYAKDYCRYAKEIINTVSEEC